MDPNRDILGRVLRIQQRKLHSVKGVFGGYDAKECPEETLSSSKSRETIGLCGLWEGLGVTPADVTT